MKPFNQIFQDPSFSQKNLSNFAFLNSLQASSSLVIILLIMKFTLITLIGIPASGKTTLADKILTLSRENEINSNVIVVNFDKLLKLNFDEISDGDYKKSREELFTRVKNIIEKLKISMDIDIPQNFHHINHDNSSTLIILDDNAYYRSMRQRARQICKSHNCNHFQIFMKTSLSDAIARNSKREDAVSESVIEKMHRLLEVPENPRTIFIDIEKLNCDEFLIELKDRIENAEVLTEEYQKEPQEQSVIHEIDLITRKEVGNKLKEMKDCENLKELSEVFNVKRKEFLESIKSGKFTFKNNEILIQEFRNFLK